MKFVDWFCQNMRTGFLQFGEKSTNSKTTMTPQNFTTLKYGRAAEESSTLALRQGVFMGQDCSTVQMTGTKCQVVSRK